MPKPGSFDEMDDHELNGLYQESRDGGGGEGPEMYHRKFKQAEFSDEIEHFGSADD